MDKHFDFDLKEYYSNLHLSRNILFLYSSRILIQVGIGLLSVFTALYFYEKFNESFTAVMLLFILIYASFVILTPISAMLIKHVGIKAMLIVAVIFHPFAYISLLYWDTNPDLALYGFLIAVILYRAIYWAPYHINFAKFTDKKHRGKQMSFLLNFSEIFLTIMPMIAGIIIASYGFNVLFVVATVFLFLGLFPLLYIDKTCEVYSFGYFETFKKLFVKENRSLTLAYFGDGIQTAVRIAIWPIFIYILLDGKYVAIGVITSFTIFLLIAFRFVLGNLEHKIDRKKLLRFGSFFSTTGWILKAFIDTGFEIFVVDSYHKVGRMVNRLTFDVTTYDQAADNGHYIDEYTVLKEISVSAGRTFMLILAIWLTIFFSISATFLFAAGATLLMTLLHREVYIQ